MSVAKSTPAPVSSSRTASIGTPYASLNPAASSTRRAAISMAFERRIRAASAKRYATMAATVAASASTAITAATVRRFPFAAFGFDLPLSELGQRDAGERRDHLELGRLEAVAFGTDVGGERIGILAVDDEAGGVDALKEGGRKRAVRRAFGIVAARRAGEDDGKIRLPRPSALNLRISRLTHSDRAAAGLHSGTSASELASAASSAAPRSPAALASDRSRNSGVSRFGTMPLPRSAPRSGLGIL